jgi:hypothetical protein
MPDNLTDEFSAYAAALTPPRPPDYAGVVRLIRRRRRRQASAGVAAVVALAVVAGAVLVRSDQGGRSSTVAVPSTEPSLSAPVSVPPAPVSAEVYAWLRAAALRMAAGDGELHPTRLEAVAVDDVDAAVQALSGSVNLKPVKRAGYVVEAAGHFVCGSCSVPPGAKAPTGTVTNAVLLAADFSGIEGGIDSHWVDLSTLGNAFDLAPASTYLPDMSAHPSRQNTGLPQATVVSWDQIAGPAGWQVQPPPSTTSKAAVQPDAAVLSAARAAGGAALTTQSRPIAALAYVTATAGGAVPSKRWVWLVELTEALVPNTSTATGTTANTKLAGIIWVLDASTGHYLTSATF